MKYTIDHYLENIYFHYKIGFIESKIYKDTYWCNSTAGANNLSIVDFAYTQIEKDNNMLEAIFEAFCEEKKLKPNLMKLVRRVMFVDAYDNELVPKYFINVKDKSE